MENMNKIIMFQSYVSGFSFVAKYILQKSRNILVIGFNCLNIFQNYEIFVFI